MRLFAAAYRPVTTPSTWRDATYLLLGLIFGLLWGIFALVGYAVGIALAIVWVGVPILVGTHRSMREIGTAERLSAEYLLDISINPPPPLAPVRHLTGATPGDRFWAWSRAVFHDAHAWRVLLWVLGRLVLGPLGFVIAVVCISLSFVPGAMWGVVAVADLHRRLATVSLGECGPDVANAANARAQLAEEQVRIDQELHDSIGHMITMNIVQAGAGAHVFESDPEFARQALRNIEDRGRAAMGELDRIIAAIRGDKGESRTPLPGLAELPELVASSRAAGMVVTAKLSAPDVPDAIGRAAYAVVRESLTNAAKHAPGAAVELRVELDGDALGIEVTNGIGANRQGQAVTTLPADQRGGTRRGLTGMRDRVHLLGGRSEMGAIATGGYRVAALIPLEVSLAPASALPKQSASSPWRELRERVQA